MIGKALMLDEIINYVQSLQQQVEVRHGTQIVTVPKLFVALREFSNHFAVLLFSVLVHEALDREPAT